MVLFRTVFNVLDVFLPFLLQAACIFGQTWLHALQLSFKQEACGNWTRVTPEVWKSDTFFGNCTATLLPVHKKLTKAGCHPGFHPSNVWGTSVCSSNRTLLLTYIWRCLSGRWSPPVLASIGGEVDKDADTAAMKQLNRAGQSGLNADRPTGPLPYSAHIKAEPLSRPWLFSSTVSWILLRHLLSSFQLWATLLPMRGSPCLLLWVF